MRSSRNTPVRRSERISADTDRDFILTPEEAKAYGVVDHVIEPAELRRLSPGNVPLASGVPLDRGAAPLPGGDEPLPVR